MKGDGELKFFLFGRPSIQYKHSHIVPLETSKMQELFCYLLIHRNHPLSRESLGELLWSDIPPDRSKKHIRQTLWQLQSYLKSEQLHNVVIADNKWIQINGQIDFWLDIDQFEKAFNLFLDLDGNTLQQKDADCLRDAIKVYQGDLLEGCYQDWCLIERERYQNMYFELLEKLMDFCIIHQQFEEGIEYGNQVLNYDCARERTQYRLMNLYFLSGNRIKAIRQYERCAAVLRGELNVDPSINTQALLKKILGDPEDMSFTSGGKDQDLPEALIKRISELLNQLRLVQTTLNDAQKLLSEEIRQAERVLTRHLHN